MKKLTIATLASHMFIIVAIGHGIAPFGVMIIVAFLNIFLETGDKALWESPFLPTVVVGAIGQLCVLVALFLSDKIARFFTIAGVILMSISFAILLRAISMESTVKITVFTGLPFIFLAVVVLVKTFQEFFPEEYEDE